MHVRRLEVHGFKSFADRQRFDFGPGLTVVVGPNGSGKSNVSDAIRWVLGETSARQIRARKTEDVIFSGSDLRRQLGAAEVSLTLDNSDGWMPIDFAEVTVTRRAVRSGESEYLINGQRVRLADVLDLFGKADVGQNSYAMMSQGLVDEVLALRPSERRDLVEEAADVRRHRQQMTLSERRLSETRDNLGHVRMLIREVEPRLRQLERQSKRAERYRELSAQLQQALVAYYEQELRRANEALAAARARHDQETQEFNTARTELERLDTRLEQLTAIVAERRDVLESRQAKERELAEEALRLEQQVALAEQRGELLASRRGELEAELAAAGQQPPDDAEDGDAGDAAELRLTEARGVLEREQEALRSADGAARAALRELAEAEAKRARLEAELADAERRIEERERERSRRAGRWAQAEARRAEALEALRALGRRALVLDRAGRDRDAAVTEARNRRDAAERRLEDQLRMLIEARDAVRVAESRVREHEQRRTMVEQLLEAAPAGNAVEALLDASRARPDGGDGGDEPLTGVVDAVSRVIRVPNGLETAIEAALAEQLNAVIVEREADAVAAVEYLRTHEAGAATVYPLDAIEHAYPLNLFNERGVVGVAARLVRCDARYRALVDTLLGRTIVVDDLRTAQQMVTRGLGSVVTRDGVLLRKGGAYYGGRAGAGVARFSLQRDLEEIPEQLASAQDVAQAARDRLHEREETAAAARPLVDAARAAVDEGERQRREHEQELARLRRDQAALNGEMQLVRQAVGEAGDDTTAEDLAGRRDEARRALDAAGEAIARLRDRAEAVGAERDVVAERVTAASAQFAAAEGVRRATEDQRREQAEAARRARTQAARRREQLLAARREGEDLELSLRDLREQAANVRSALARAQQAVGPAHAALAEAATEEHELRAQRGDRQARLFAAERAIMEAEGALRDAATRTHTLNQQLDDEGLAVDEHGVVRGAGAPAGEAGTLDAAGEAVAQEAAQPVRGGAEVPPEELRDRISELRGEIRALGPVNVEALEDLSEERERSEFLRGQVDDLESAEQELRGAIAELRKLIRTRFDETFERVNVAFGDYFSRFFGGGSATLSLVEGAEGEDPGIDIEARPPGKRIASLNVLSGGERSLTSVALLFALLSVNPAPVCVLDEVDAALDEANVGRFVDCVREMTARSQFILISHSRATIEAADAIYGISMGEDSTSQVLSLRLADLPQPA